MLSGQKCLGSPIASTDSSTLVHSFQVEDDLQPWEQYWDLESQIPTKEFTGPEKEEKAKVNKQVLQEFNDTIQRRSDGYYVRIPFKKDHDELPDNRALAWKRLRSILQTYTDQPSILQQYDQVFKDQLQKGILEEVHESNDLFSVKKHYLSHLPVFTPHKETTKFRVVFDASAHYKNCPSLNDVTHQRPTMLPKLYSILLRFRVGKYVLISDVEKAFLQVRLQERDRDFTRCLWVKDINKPLTEENLAVYRFTRVTFGINASPFLLSATILFHLRHSVEKKDLAEEIATNLYVDNLFTCAETKEDAIQKYVDLKDIFSEIQMNLREFMANSSEIMDSIAEHDRSSNKSPKVLVQTENRSRRKRVRQQTCGCTTTCFHLRPSWMVHPPAGSGKAFSTTAMETTVRVG
uniref:Reverse transcriptase domain-containing protein n=1 Tax=Haemonchus contortus TaxID=6289 RepID=A0A7I4Y5Q5_HAECO